MTQPFRPSEGQCLLSSCPFPLQREAEDWGATSRLCSRPHSHSHEGCHESGGSLDVSLRLLVCKKLLMWVCGHWTFVLWLHLWPPFARLWP